MSAGALDAIDRILNRGGDVDDILRDVVGALVEHGGCTWAGILFAEAGELVLGPQAGTPQPDNRLQIPVVYGGDGGPHMADVMAHTGLDIDRIAAIHSAPTYVVYALGSHPGYCYLGGMDPRIATPRRKMPVVSIPGGAVSIGGAQTGVSASAGPSGWNTIGSTSMRFFEPALDPPALFRPGDRLRFRITEVIR